MNKELLINTYEDNTLLFKENLLGRLENNILTYENDTDSFIIDLNNLIFKKENLESILEINNKQAILTVKELECSIDITLNKRIFTRDNNNITIEYLLESTEKPIKIKIEMSDINES